MGAALSLDAAIDLPGADGRPSLDFVQQARESLPASSADAASDSFDPWSLIDLPGMSPAPSGLPSTSASVEYQASSSGSTMLVSQTSYMDASSAPSVLPDNQQSDVTANILTAYYNARDSGPVLFGNRGRLQLPHRPAAQRRRHRTLIRVQLLRSRNETRIVSHSDCFI